jgi:hypothetical protein
MHTRKAIMPDYAHATNSHTYHDGRVEQQESSLHGRPVIIKLRQMREFMSVKSANGSATTEVLTAKMAKKDDDEENERTRTCPIPPYVTVCCSIYAYNVQQNIGNIQLRIHATGMYTVPATSLCPQSWPSHSQRSAQKPRPMVLAIEWFECWRSQGCTHIILPTLYYKHCICKRMNREHQSMPRKRVYKDKPDTQASLR